MHKHRIIPGHQGGKYTPENVILLTPEEHAEAHKKLWEEYGRQQDYIAWKALSGQISSEEARILAVTAALKGKPKSKEHIEKMSKSLKGRLVSLETREKLRIAALGKPKSKTHKDKISQAMQGNKRCLGRKDSKETKKKRNESLKKYWADSRTN